MRDVLHRWESLLAAEGFPVRFVEATDELPTDLLMVGALTDEDENVLVQLEIYFIPGMEAQLQGGSLVQLIAPVAQITSGNEENVSRLIMALNCHMPMVGFSVLEEEGVFIFRHMAILPNVTTAADPIIVQAVWMISYTLSLYAPVLADLAAGGISYEEALASDDIRELIGE